MALTLLQWTDLIVTIVTIVLVLYSNVKAYLKVKRLRTTFSGQFNELLKSFQILNVFFTLVLVGYFLLRLAHESYSILSQGFYFDQSTIMLNVIIDVIILLCSAGLFVSETSMTKVITEMSKEYGFNEEQRRRIRKRISAGGTE